MDYFFHQREEEESGAESLTSVDSEDIKNDIESRLYSVIYHNDFTQQLAPELEALYSIEETEQGEIIVSVKDGPDSIENFLKGTENNQDVPCSDSDQNFVTTLNVDENSNMKKRKFLENENSLNSVNNYSKNFIADMDKYLMPAKSQLPNSKHGRYSDVLITHEPQSKESLVNGDATEKNMLDTQNWKNNSKLDFIPIGGAPETNLTKYQSHMEKIFRKTTKRHPEIDLDNFQFRKILLKIAAKEKKRFNMRTILYNHKIFQKKFKKHKPVHEKKSDQTEPIKKVECDSIEVIDSDIEILDKNDLNSDVQILEVPITNNEHCEKNNSDQEFKTQNFFDKNVKHMINIWLMDRPSLSVFRIKKKLRLAGYRYTVKELLTRLYHSQFTNIKFNQEQRLFLNKLATEGKPLIPDIIQCNRNTNAETSVPVINIESSDDETKLMEEPEIILNTNEKVRKTKLSNVMPDCNIDSISKTDNSVTVPPACPPMKWTKEMIRFYDKESKRLKSFDHKKIKLKLSGQNSNPNSWSCCSDDYTKQCKRRKDEINMQCSNCLKFGHIAFSCRQEKSTKICAMCGEEGHRLFTCPQKKCFNCGDSSSNFCIVCRKCENYSYSKVTCQICGRRNHPQELCTDLWRCYHNTTTAGPIVNTIQTPNTSKCCSYCSKKGHFAHDCKLDGFGRRSNSVFIKNYNPLHLLSDYRDIMLSSELYNKLQSQQGEEYLQDLSDKCKIRIDIVVTNNNGIFLYLLRCFGSPEQWLQVRSELMTWSSGTDDKKKKHKKSV